MILKLENITKKYGDFFALNNINCEFSEGIYGILGPNGSGKSTLMRIMVEVLAPTMGRVTYDNRDISVLGDQYREILGYVPQNFGAYKSFSAEKFLLYVAALKGIKEKDAVLKIHNLLEKVGLNEVKTKKLKTFSAGMLQRLGIVQALLNDPKILILDEPTAGLDPNERMRLKNILSEFSKEKIIILSTHIVSDLEYIAKEVLILKNGSLIEKKSPEELLKRISDKVWCICMASEEYLRVKDDLKIINICRFEENVELRVISEKKPYENAVKDSPKIEDIYVYYFGI